MGNKGGVTQVTESGEQIVSVPAPTGSSFYKFHPRCGAKVDVMYSGRVAKRQNPADDFKDAVVLTRQPLENNERFEVRMDTKVSRWSGSLEIGFTSNSPLELDFPPTMTDCRYGVTLMWSGANVFKNGEEVSSLEVDLDDCTVGDTIGIERKDDGSVRFYFNGECLKKAVRLRNIPSVVYGVVDLYGQAGSVTICETDNTGVNEPQSPHPRTKGEISSNDPNALMFNMRSTVELMKRGIDVDIGTVVERVAVTLLQPYCATANDKIRQRFGDHLASLGGAGQLTKLLNRLNDIGMESAWTGMEIVRSTCWNYSDASLKAGSQFGRSGLPRLMLEDLDLYKNRKTKTKKARFIMMSALSILHNCSKVSENKQMYHDIKAVERIAPFLKLDDMELAMIALLTLSYIVEDSKIHLLEANAATVGFLIELLKSALADPQLYGQSKESRYSAFELVMGLGKIAANTSNAVKIVDSGAVPLLMKLMEKNDRPMVQECAANALWVLARVDETRRKISATQGVLAALARLARSENEAVGQAAERALLRIKPPQVQGQVLGKTKAKRPSCQYWKLCERFKNSLKLPGKADVYFNKNFDMCYCTGCHNDRGDKLYYARGQPAKDYGVPIGWCRFALEVPPQAKAEDVFNKWHVAFHGTKIDAVASILKHGYLLMPGDYLMDGTKLCEAPGHFTPDHKPEGFDTKQLFLSPSIRYSGCDVYAPQTSYRDAETDKKYQARVVFQVCIKPDAYKVGQQTIGATYEIDPLFSNQEIEWYTKNRGCVTLYGLLFKLE
ncbi:neuralized-like protein 4 [Ptychodera flava]|uniref:neuralized-like protein 4 n=1 Tax=Ptychodera flava TaxID=63121 RepID=UPI00396A976B